MTKDIYTEKDVALYLNIKPIKRIQELLDQGILGFYDINGERRIGRKHIDQYLKRVEFNPNTK